MPTTTGSILVYTVNLCAAALLCLTCTSYCNPPTVHVPVMSCLQQRFVLDESHQPPRIRAAQGHSVTLSDPQLTPVTDAAAVPVAVHATSQAGWQAIQASGELRRMSRSVASRLLRLLCLPGGPVDMCHSAEVAGSRGNRVCPAYAPSSVALPFGAVLHATVTVSARRGAGISCFRKAPVHEQVSCFRRDGSLLREGGQGFAMAGMYRLYRRPHKRRRCHGLCHCWRIPY